MFIFVGVLMTLEELMFVLDLFFYRCTNGLLGLGRE